MLVQALIDTYQLPESVEAIRQDALIPTYLDKGQRFRYNDRPDVPRIQHSHSAFSWPFCGRRVLFLVRDLRDTLVSHYRVAQPRLGLPKDFGGFIRGETIDRTRHHDLVSRIAFLNSWARGRHSCVAFKIVRYEDLRERTSEELAKILEFIGFPRLESEQLERLVKVGDIRNMQRLEGQQDDVSYRKVSGQPSRFVDYFGPDERRLFKNEVRGRLIDSFGYDYEDWSG